MSTEIIQIPVGPMANFAYLIVDTATKKAAVVDPGWDSQKILAKAAELGVTIDAIWLTHTHFDHVRDIPGILASAPVPIWVHGLERDLLDDELSAVTSFNEGDALTIGTQRADILHTPGHSPGSVCFQIGDHLITGDALFVGAIGRTDLPGSDSREMGKSLKRLATLPDHLIIYPGHDYGDRPTSTIAHEKKTNPYMNL